MDDLDPQARDIERLLAAIDRIRGERDVLRRDLDWVNMENKFKVDALEARLVRAQHQVNAASFHMKRSQRGTCVAILVTQYLLCRCDAFDSEAPTIAAAFEGTQRSSRDVDDSEGDNGRVRELEEENARLRDSLATSQGQFAVVEVELAEARNSMTAAEEAARDAEDRISHLQAERHALQQDLFASRDHLQTAESRFPELTDRITALEDEVARERASLARAEEQITELGASVDNAESTRDSFALQITHLTQDLDNARRELEGAEARYTELQAQQLSSMSSSEVTRTLRQKIEDLEYRVQHRTEQVGFHQHDIKRLETNMRLQEERIAEMTSDLEVLQGEKATMIEDCNTTREERDEALRRCEELEQRMEVLEEGKSHTELDRDVEMQAVVELVFQEKITQRHLRHRLVSAWSKHAEREFQLQAEVREADTLKSCALQQLEDLGQERSSAVRLMEQKAIELESLRSERDAAISQAQESLSALDTLRAEFTMVSASMDALQEQSPATQMELSQLQAQLKDKVTEATEVAARHQSLCVQYDEMKASLTSQITDLEDQLRSFQDTHADIDARHQHAEHEMSRLAEELHAYRSSGTESASLQERLRCELEETHAAHLEETGDLRAEIAQTLVKLEDARRSYVDVQATHRLALEDLTQAKEDLESRLAAATVRLQASDGAQAELVELQDRHASETQDLQERLERVSHQLETTRGELQAQAAGFNETVRHLEEQLSEASDVLHAKEDLDMEIVQLRVQHEAEIHSLERRIADLISDEKVAKQSLSDLEAQCRTLDQEKSDLEDALARTTADVDELEDQIKVLSEKHELTLKRHAEELSVSAGSVEESQHARTELAAQLTSVRQQLQETQLLVETLGDEKRQLQSEMTEVEAEIQRSLSMQRFQDSHLKDSEREILSLREQLAQARAEYVEAEKTAKAAEINMELQSVQHEKVLSSLRREISSLRESPNLEDTVTELTERNNEMEQLLQAKCLEIEENDDRVIELLKEKKKLTSKVDNLTKKINILQTKVSASSAPTGVTPPQLHAQRASVTNTVHIAPLAPVASSSRTPMLPTPLTPNSRRLNPGANVPRPKTPEARVPPPPVFKARTPESKRSQAKTQPQYPPPPPQVLVASSSSLGKKRRAPDDFEDCESLPPQVFTVDSVPSQEAENGQATTPRVRRALQAVRSGFTPVRSHSVQQPTRTVLTSPARRATTGAPLIADVTNSPRGPSLGANDKASKRGWLGKIRGGPGQSNAPRSVSSRPPVFDRQISGGSSK